MKASLRAYVVSACVALTIAVGTGLSLAHQSETGKPGVASKANLTVKIRMSEGDGKMSYGPSVVRVKRGQTVRFEISNDGQLDHELVIDTIAGNRKHKREMEKNPDMEHDDPNAVRLKPKADGSIVWQFTRRGTFEYACLIPGHYDAGMHGKIIVE